MKYLVNILLALVLVIINIKLSSEEEKMVITLDIANANLVINKLLTLSVRNYIITGDTKYRDNYFTYSAIRDGSGAWDKILKFPWFKDKTVTMDGLYTQLKLNKDDIKPLETAHNDSIQLMWTEIVAMNMYEGYVDDDEEAKKIFDSQPLPKKYINFKKKIEDTEELKKMKQESIDMLYNDDYLTTENSIAILSQKGVELVLNRQQNTIKTYRILFYVFITIFIAYNIYFTYSIYTNRSQSVPQSQPQQMYQSRFMRTSPPYYT